MHTNESSFTTTRHNVSRGFIMEQKKMTKIIEKAVKAHSEKNPADVNTTLIALITAGANATTALNTIKKAFRKAGIIAAPSVSNLAKVREHLTGKDVVPKEGFTGYAAMKEFASALQGDFNINDDEAKGITSALKLVKEQLKTMKLDVPRRSQLGDIAELKVEYYVTEPQPHTVKGLTQYLTDNLDTKKWPMDKEGVMAKRLAVSAGTDFTYSQCLFNRKTLSEMN